MVAVRDLVLKSTERSGFNGALARGTGALAIAGILKDEDVARKVFDRMRPTARVTTVTVKKEKTIGREWAQNAFESPEFLLAESVSAKPRFEADRKNAVRARWEVDEFALCKVEEQTDPKISDNYENQRLPDKLD